MELLSPPQEQNVLQNYLESLSPASGVTNVVYDVQKLTNGIPDLVNKTWTNQNGIWTPLLYICGRWLWVYDVNNRNIGTNLIEVLLSLGADPNKAGLIFRDEMWLDNVSPLYLAAEANGRGAVEYLLGGGADVGVITSDGRTVIHGLYNRMVAYSGSDAVSNNKYLLEMFLRREVDINAQDNQGRTALHLLVQNYSHPAFRYVPLLLDNGASVEITDTNGRNILELAAEEGHLGLVESLLTMKAWSIQQAAEAYELLSLNYSGMSCYEMLMKATRIRQNGECPKEVQEPLSCYRGFTEWQTERQLGDMKYAEDFLATHSYIAYERIFKDRKLNLRKMNSYILRRLQDEDPRVKLLLLRQIELFHRNGDYTLFFHVYDLFTKTLIRHFQTRNQMEVIQDLPELAIFCCEKLASLAKRSSRLVDFKNISLSLGRTAVIALKLIQHHPNLTEFVKPQLRILSVACDLDIPFYNYRQNLLFIFLNQMLINSRTSDFNLGYPLTLLIPKYNDCNFTDVNKNNCLHLAAAATFLPDANGLIRVLLEEGAHYDGRNCRGLTAEDIAKIKSPELYNILRGNCPLPSLKCLCSRIIKFKPSHELAILPKPLALFVELH